MLTVRDAVYCVLPEPERNAPKGAAAVAVADAVLVGQKEPLRVI